MRRLLFAQQLLADQIHIPYPFLTHIYEQYGADRHSLYEKRTLSEDRVLFASLKNYFSSATVAVVVAAEVPVPVVAVVEVPVVLAAVVVVVVAVAAALLASR